MRCRNTAPGNAVSPLIPRRSATITCTRVTGTPMSFAKPVRGDPERLHELLPELFAGMDWRQVAHAVTSMIVDDLDPVGSSLAPHEADAPGVLNPKPCASHRDDAVQG